MNFPSVVTIMEGPGGYGVSCTDTRAGYLMYQCPGCGRILKHPMVSIYMLDTTCKCNYPNCVYMMNFIGSWKHPNWIEFDEKSYWEDKGMVTHLLWEGEPLCQEIVWENRWIAETLRLSPPSVPNVKVTTQEKSTSLISKIKSFFRG